MREDLHLSRRITQVDIDEDDYSIRIEFNLLNLEQERKLVTILFCRPEQRKRKNIPGEFYSLWLLIKILLCPKVLFYRNYKINVIDVIQT